MDSANNKGEAIAALQNLFGEMTSSRTKLKPILTEIVKALDDNLFVDADSDEVHDLLEEIIDIQSQFAAVDEIRGAVSSKSVDKIEAALHNMEIKHAINELKIVLNQFAELQCRSEKESERAAADKLMLQARKLLLRVEKYDAEEFLGEGVKFEYIAKIIRSREKPSSEEISKVHEMFSDITLAYLLMDRALSFASDESAEDEAQEKLSPLEALKAVIDKLGINVDSLIADESEFKIEERELKKRMSSKAFQSKLKDFGRGKDAEFRSKLRYFMERRFESLKIIQAEQSDENNIEPLIFDMLYKIHAVDKISWQAQSFYYINDYGYEMLTKTLSDGKPPSRKSTKQGIAHWMRKFTVLKVLNIFRLDGKKFSLESDVTQFRFRVRPLQESSAQVYYAMTLMLFEANWLEQLSITIRHLKNETAEGYKIRAVLLCTTLKGAQLMPWFQLFEESGVPNVFAVRIDGKIVWSDGEEYEIAELQAYINENEFDTFAEYKKKYIKRRKRRRKKTDDDDGEPSPPKSNSSSSRRKKLTTQDEPPKVEGDTTSTISLFSPPASDNQYSFDPSEFQEMLKKKSETLIEEPKLENEEAPEPKEEPEIKEEPPATIEPVEEAAPIEETVQVEEIKAEEPEAENFFERFQLPSAAEANLDIDLERILINATVMFLKGNAARGLMELHLCEGLKSEGMDWAKDLTKLTAAALHDPLSRPSSHEFMPLEFCNELFDRPAPLDVLDAEFLKGFYVTMFVIMRSYAPDMNAIYELRAQQAQLLSDKTNAALKMCPSIKKLISLFKAFTDKTNSSFAESLHIDHAGVRARLKAAESALEMNRLRAENAITQQIRHPRVKALVYKLFAADAELRRLLDLNGVTLEDITKFYTSFLALPIDDETAAGEKVFAPQKLDAYLDGIWESIKVDSHKSENFMGNERTKQTNALEKALIALREYAIVRRQFDALGDDSSASKSEALSLIKNIRAEFDANVVREFDVNLLAPSVLMIFLNQLRSGIEDRASTMFYRECLLGEKYIELTSSDLPDMDDWGAAHYSFAHRLIEYEHALSGLTSEEALKSAYETAVRTYDLGIIDRLEKNYGDQLTRPSEERQRLRAAMSAQVDKRLDILHGGFIKKLALDLHYGRLLNPAEAEYYEMAAATAMHHFGETRNAGLFERFIDALNIGIETGTEAYVKDLRDRLNEVEPQSRATVENLIDSGRLNVAEDCINGGVLTEQLANDNGLEDFLSSSELIYSVSVKNKNDPIEKILLGLKRDLKDKQLLEFAEAWQNISTKTFAIPILLKHLSFEGATLEPIKKLPNSQMEFHATFDCAPRDVPIALFNSRLRTDGLDFLCVHYPLSVEELIERLRTIERRQCGLICLLNMALSLADRRKLAQAMKIRDIKNIIVIDRVLAVYLTAFEQSARRERLLKAALPFANVNPFDEPSPEMFVDRERELEALRDINGATFLIGARSIGKTALLERLIALEHKPEEDSYVIRSDGTDVERLRAEVIERLSSDEVRKVIAVFDINRMFATLDDNLKPLEQLMWDYSGRFKYIVTAHHGLEMSESAVRLRPLTESEATRLTLEPLNYLGLRVNDIGVMRSVWLRANYNPAMLRYYCGRIVAAIADGYAQKKFYATGNPPYEFDDEFLKRMNVSLDGLFERVLHNGRDDYYYVLMLALALAPGYYGGESQATMSRLQEIFLMSDIDDLATMDGEQMELLLEEMVGLKLFRRVGDAYEFYRREYRRMFGDDKALERRLSECKKNRSGAIE